MKKNLFGVFALILAVVFSSFTQINKKQQSPLVWFDVVAGYTSTTNGVLLTARPDGCANDITDLCARGFDISDCDEETQSGITTYSLKTGLDPDEVWDDEGYEE